MANFYSENLDLIFFIKNRADFYLEKCRSDFIKNMVDIFWKNADLVFYLKQSRFLFGKMQIWFFFEKETKRKEIQI